MITVKDSIKLSTRLEMVASLVPYGVNCADIGADHGYLICSLIAQNKIVKGYACENKIGPYKRLKSNVEALNLGDKVYCDLSDGIRTLPKDYNCVIIAGMGGDTVDDIISFSKEKLENIEYFIISSHSKMSDVRKYLTSNSYEIIDEKACFDANQYYEVALFKKGKNTFNNFQLEYGPILLKNKDKHLLLSVENKLNFNQNLLNKDSIPESRKEQILNENLELNKIIDLLK